MLSPSRYFCGSLALVAVLLSYASSSLAAAGALSRPNIVVILVDDMGFSDIGCYGSEIPTPNLDGLAAGGLRFTQFYNTGRCCPTRASLMTGLYSHQAGMGHMTEDRGEDGYRGDLNEHCVTIAEVLGTAGYRTAMAGKWHVTKFVKPRNESQKYNWPLQRGFEHYFGIIQGAADYFYPKPLTSDNQIIQPSAGFYTTDAFVDNAIRFVDEGDKAKPFFLYLAFNAPHYPLQAPQDEIAQYRGKYKIGWDRLRQQRYARQIEPGHHRQGVGAVAFAAGRQGVGPRPICRAGPLRPHHGHLRRGRCAHGPRRGPARCRPARAQTSSTTP